MNCVFCEILHQHDPKIIIFEDEEVFVIPTNTPLRAGHLLIIPKTHIEDGFNMPEAQYLHLFEIARHLEPILKRVYQAPKVSLLLAGMEIPHVHLHICPIFSHGDMDSSKAHKASAEEMAQVADTLRGALA